LREARAEGVSLREEQAAKAREEAGKIEAAAEKEVGAKLEKARQEIAALVERESSNIDTEAESLGTSLFETSRKTTSVSATRH